MVGCTETADPIETSFVFYIQVSPRKYMLGGARGPSGEGAILFCPIGNAL